MSTNCSKRRKTKNSINGEATASQECNANKKRRVDESSSTEKSNSISKTRNSDAKEVMNAKNMKNSDRIQNDVEKKNDIGENHMDAGNARGLKSDKTIEAKRRLTDDKEVTEFSIRQANHQNCKPVREGNIKKGVEHFSNPEVEDTNRFDENTPTFDSTKHDDGNINKLFLDCSQAIERMIMKMYRSGSYQEDRLKKLKELTLMADKPETLNIANAFLVIHEVFEMLKNKKSVMPEKAEEVRHQIVEKLKARFLCCGESCHEINTGALECNYEQGCEAGIKPGSKFFNLDDFSRDIELSYCALHFNSLSDSFKLENGIEIFKSDFKEESYERVEKKEVEQCPHCKKYWHEKCRQWARLTDPQNCECKRDNDETSNFKAEDLRPTKLSEFLQMFIKKQFDDKIDNVIIRELFSDNSTYFSTKEGMNLKKLVDEMKLELTDHEYRSRMIGAFQKIDGMDVLLFAMFVREHREISWVDIDYLDSVNYLVSKGLRTQFYQSMILGYYDFVRRHGMQMGHIWADPAKPDENYIFNGRPSGTRFPDLAKLIEWYDTTLKQGESMRITEKKNSPLLLKRENASFCSIFNRLRFSGYWRAIIRELLEEYKNNNSTFDAGKFETKLKKEMKQRTKNVEKKIFYFDLQRNKNEKTADKNPLTNEEEQANTINVEFTKSREKFLHVLESNGWTFTTLDNAKLSTHFIIQRIMKESAVTQNIDGAPSLAPRKPPSAENKWIH